MSICGLQTRTHKIVILREKFTSIWLKKLLSNISQTLQVIHILIIIDIYHER